MKRLFLLLLLLALASPAWAQTTTFIESGSDATQSLAFFNATSGNVSSSTAQAKTGPRSIALFTDNPAVTAYAEARGVLADAGRRVSYWVRWDDLGTIGTTPGVIFIGTTAGAGVANIQFQTGVASLRIAPVGATAVNGTAIFTAGVWYRLTLSFYITNTTTFAFKLYVNGVLDITATAGTLTRAGADRIRFIQSDALGVSKTAWVDDIYIDDGASSGSQPDTGDRFVTAKRPSANGTANAFGVEIGAGPAPNGIGTGHAPNISEQPLSQTYGWSVVNAGSAQTEEYNIQGRSSGDVDITSNTVVDYIGWVFASSLASSNASIMLNGSSSGTIALTSTPAMFFKAAGSTVYPLGTGTDVGIVTDTTATTVSLYESGVVVAYGNSSGSCNGAMLRGFAGC